ncbi:hypothetical protein R3P38DRAFT_2570471 [Favolaschia claudopus]|uniref:Uncharacterized protein n=1 Tax=Favolaschia claudopus TaxID=2862362 RepID=A0AAV9ZUH5_9AGAR
MNANSYSSSDGLPSLSSTPSWHSTPGLPSLPPNSEGWGSSPANNRHCIPNHAGTPSPPTGAFNFDHHRSSSPLSSVEQQVDSRHHAFLPPTPVVIKPLFIDTLARDMRLEDSQTQSLHDFVALGSTGGGLSQADLVTRLYMLAVQFSDMAERRRIAAAETPTDFTGLWKDLKIRLSGNFTFTKDQEKNIRGVVRDVIIEPSRTVYSTMHHDVLDILKKRTESLSLDNVFGVPAREQALGSQVRAAGSSVRNAFRTEYQIVASIQPKSWLSLAQFTYDCVQKYKSGGVPADIPSSYSAHLALLRRFAFDNPDLASAPASAPASTPTPRKRARVPAGKGKNKPRGGRIAAGEDFWGRVDEFFRKEVEDRGTNLTGPKWKPYIDKLVVDDNANFRGQTPGRAVEGPAQAVGMHLAPTPRVGGSSSSSSVARLQNLLS